MTPVDADSLPTTRHPQLAALVIAAVGLLVPACAGPAVVQTPAADIEPLELATDEWKERLTDMEFAVLREEATEPAGSSPLNQEKREGEFVCAGCGLGLFRSGAKYESGTGWPSFWDVIEGNVVTKTDYRLGIPRTEYHCARCEGHQGHVFRDGPEPTGLRYCNNGVALDFVPASEEE